MIDDATALNIAAHILFASGSRKLTSSEIAEIAMRLDSLPKWQAMGYDLSTETDVFDLSRRIGQSLSRHVQNHPTRQQVVSGSRNGWTLGAKANTVLAKENSEFSPSVSTLFTGLAGEYAVISELLSCDWNATKLPVDDGVDVVATRGHEIRTVQVKTANTLQHNPERFQFQVDRESHEKFSNIRHYYFLVMHRRLPHRWLNDFLVLSSPDFESFNERGAFYGGEREKWTVSVEIHDGRYLLRGEEKFEVTDRVNSIKSRFK